MVKRAAFSIPFGKQIKSVVNRLSQAGETGRGSTRQFSNTPGEFRLAKVVEVPATFALGCEVEVYRVLLVTAEYVEAVGAQTLTTAELTGASVFAAARIDETYELGDIVSIDNFNSRFWILGRVSDCEISSSDPPSSGSGACCEMGNTLTVTPSGISSLPTIWQNILVPFVMTPSHYNNFSGGRICRYVANLGFIPQQSVANGAFSEIYVYGIGLSNSSGVNATAIVDHGAGTFELTIVANRAPRIKTQDSGIGAGKTITVKFSGVPTRCETGDPFATDAFVSETDLNPDCTGTTTYEAHPSGNYWLYQPSSMSVPPGPADSYGHTADCLAMPPTSGPATYPETAAGTVASRYPELVGKTFAGAVFDFVWS